MSVKKCRMGSRLSPVDSEVRLMAKGARLPPDGAKATQEVIRLYRDGEISKQEMQEKLFLYNWWFVFNQVNFHLSRIMADGRLAREHRYYQDMLGEAQLVLLRAIESYEPIRGVLFISYLGRALQNFLSKEYGALTVPLDKKGAFPRRYHSLWSGDQVPYDVAAEVSTRDAETGDAAVEAARVVERLSKYLSVEDMALLREKAEGMSSYEIGAREGVSRQAIDQRVAKARRKARRILANIGESLEAIDDHRVQISREARRQRIPSPRRCNNKGHRAIRVY